MPRQLLKHLPAPLLASTLGLLTLSPAAVAKAPLIDSALLTAGEWIQLCRNSGRAIDPCLIQLTRPLVNKAGRSGDLYVVPRPPARTLLTRSGVLLDPAINRQISKVIADNGNMTEVVLHSGEQCKVFAAHGELLRQQDNPAAYGSLMRFITDNPAAQISTLEPATIAQRVAYRFSQPALHLIGAYVVDKPHTAGIWAVCQAAEELPSAATEAFFAAIRGSARRY